MRSLAAPTLIWLKALLFLCSGTLSAVVILTDSPRLRTGALLMIALWSFARFYYFAFHVVQHWIDPAYRFSGLLSLIAWMLRARSRGRPRPRPRPHAGRYRKIC